MKRVSVQLPQWIYDTIEGLDFPNRSEAMRAVITAGLDALLENDEIPEGLDPKVRFIMGVEQQFFFGRACKAAKVSLQEASAWLDEEGEDGDVMREAYEGARETFIESMEALIIECARGERVIQKAAMTGLIAFLNNHSKNWGRIKVEMLNRVLNPIIKDLLDIVQEEVNEATFDKISERFAAAKEVRLSVFSE